MNLSRVCIVSLTLNSAMCIYHPLHLLSIQNINPGIFLSSYISFPAFFPLKNIIPSIFIISKYFQHFPPSKYYSQHFSLSKILFPHYSPSKILFLVFLSSQKHYSQHFPSSKLLFTAFFFLWIYYSLNSYLSNILNPAFSSSKILFPAFFSPKILFPSFLFPLSKWLFPAFFSRQKYYFHPRFK